MNPRAKARRVLMVDDESSIRRAVEIMLEDFTVVCAESVADAERCIASEAPFDVALVDKNLPDGTGLSLIPVLKKHSPLTPVILVTAYPTLGSAIESIELGVYDYLVKPFNIRDLMLKVNNAADRTALETRVRRAERLELVGQLAGSVAHDFNNLLTVLRTYTDFVREFLVEQRDGGLVVDQPLADIDELFRAYASVGGVTRELLSFSGKQVLTPEPTSVNEVVERLQRTMLRTMEGRVKFETALDPDAPMVLVDVGQCEQMILNLVLNARDAMPDGGTITISTQGVESEAGDGSPQMEVRVADTGMGIPAEQIEQIFEPFFTTKGMEKGTGLGLASVRRVAETLGGSVHVESEVGRGTVFAIVLPGVSNVGLPVKHRSSLGPVIHKGKRVLVAEDDRALRESVRRILSHAGYVVVSAADGTEARQAVEVNPPALAILDIVMPGPRMEDLIARFRKTNPQLRLLLMSANAIASASDRAVTQDGERFPFLPKPFTQRALLEAVDRALAEGQLP